MNQYIYSLIRFVPDLERMEPINVGIILQTPEKIDFKMSPHAAKRKDVDTAIFQRWRSFLEEEIRGEAVPFLQPPKHSPEFVRYLHGLCDRTVSISNPLFLSEPPDVPFEDVLQRLYDRMVAPPEQTRKEQASRPTSTFRDLEEAKQFRKRGMKKHSYIELPDTKRWNAYRQVVNGENIVVDKVEVANIVGQTADEIQKLSSGVDAFLERFLVRDQRSMPPRYVLIADDLREKFTEQTDADYRAMKDELDRVLELVSHRGGQVIRRSEEVQGFAEEIDRKLPSLVESLKAD